VPTPHRSAGRFPDGADSDSNCSDFLVQAATTLAATAAAGDSNIKVASVADFSAGQKLMIGTGADAESAVIAAVGTAGATTVRTATAAGATVVPVASAMGFRPGDTISIDSGAARETAVVASAAVFGRAGASVTVSAPLAMAHERGAQVSGSGITLDAALMKPHAAGTQVGVDLPTPGAPNKYSRAGSR
jgi:hypothetical protein